MSLLTLDELKKIWTYPKSAEKYVSKALGSVAQMIEDYFKYLVCEDGYMRDNRVYSVLINTPWWDGDDMPCFFNDFLRKRLYDSGDVVKRRWEGRFDILRQKARPALQTYFKFKAAKKRVNTQVKLLSMAAICSGYKGLNRVVRQFKVDNRPYKVVNVSDPHLTVNVFSGIHYTETSQIIDRIEDWMYMYLFITSSLSLPQALILLCAEYIEIDKLKQNGSERWAYRKKIRFP